VWVEFESKPGQRTPYKFRITRLWAKADDPSTGHDLDNELPDSVQVELPPAEVPVAPSVQVPGQAGAAKGEGLGGAGDPLPVQVPVEPPVQVPLSTTSTTSTEGSEGKASSEESYDRLVGKTTAAATNFVQVVGEAAAAALERERAFLDELGEVFVVKGGGRWVEPGDDGSERR
jgi:hypothetical protein